MKFELLIIYCVSFLNSLIIKRKGKDKLFGVTKEYCENMIFGKKQKGFCGCYKNNDTFLSGENQQYKCNNEKYLGRLF